MKEPITLFCAFVAVLLSPAAIAGEIKGRQYLMLGEGPKPIADNEVKIAPCAPVNLTCMEVISTFIEMQSEHNSRPIDASGYYKTCVSAPVSDPKTLKYCQHLLYSQPDKMWPEGWLGSIGTALNLIKPLRGVKSSRTDFDGKFNLNCPTQNCLLFSSGKVGFANAVWLSIVNGNEPHDLAGSNAVSLWNSNQ